MSVGQAFRSLRHDAAFSCVTAVGKRVDAGFGFVNSRGQVMESEHPPATSAARRRAFIALVLGGMAIGCSPIFVRLSEVGATSTAFWRLALALIPLALLFAREQQDVGARKLPRRLSEHAVAAAPGVILGIELIAWHASIHMTSVANATLLANMAPVMVTLFSWLVLRQAVSRVFFIGLFLSITGAIILSSVDAPLRTGATWGDLVALLAAALYAGYLLILGHARKIYSTGTIMLWSSASAALCVLIFAVFTEPRLVPWTLAGWATVIGLAWISHACGQSLIIYALAWLPVMFSSLTLLIQPVVAAILAWLLLNEPLSTAQIIGGAIVIFGIYLGTTEQPRRETP
jgi:drug/metabolite transporter (DMT)-like permease